MHSKNVQTAITHLFDAYNARDLDQCCAAYAPELVFISRSHGMTLNGADAVRDMFGKSFEAATPARAEIDEIFDAGDTVVFTFTMHTTDPETGKAARTPWCDIVKFDAEGRIIYEDNYSGQTTPA